MARSSFKMAGWSGYQSTPMLKKQLTKEEQVSLSKHEKEKGTQITGGNQQEVINDLESRIEYLRGDLKGGTKGKVNVMEIGRQLNKLEKRLREEYAKRKKK